MSEEDKYTYTAAIPDLLAPLREERDAALRRAEKAEKKLADCAGVLFEEGVTEANIRAEKAKGQNSTFRGALDNIRHFNHREHLGTMAYLEDCRNPICKTANNVLATTPEPIEEIRELCPCDPTRLHSSGTACTPCAGHWFNIDGAHDHDRMSHCPDCAIDRCADGTGYLKPTEEAVKP